MQTITIERNIQAPAHTVWQCLTLPEHITGWNFAHESWHCPSAESDLRPNGRFSYRMEARDGSFGFDYSGVFDDIQAEHRLHYHLNDGRTVAVELLPQGGNATLLRESFQADAQHDADTQRNGWLAIAQNLARYAERQYAAGNRA